LIIRAAPDPALAEPVRFCREDDVLDTFIPFSSVILLGVVVAVEDRFHITITGDVMASACAGGVTLRKLAIMVGELRGLHRG
jgi:hypothetical protein